MNKFILTKLFLSLKEASQKGIDVDVKVLEKSHNKFVMLLYSESAAATDRTAFRNTLAYTRVELACLTGVSGKKCGVFSIQSHSAYRRTDWVDGKTNPFGTKHSNLSYRTRNSKPERTAMEGQPYRAGRAGVCPACSWIFWQYSIENGVCSIQ
jgi:hypothetical protein